MRPPRMREHVDKASEEQEEPSHTRRTYQGRSAARKTVPPRRSQRPSSTAPARPALAMLAFTTPSPYPRARASRFLDLAARGPLAPLPPLWDACCVGDGWPMLGAMRILVGANPRPCPQRIGPCPLVNESRGPGDGRARGSTSPPLLVVESPPLGAVNELWPKDSPRITVTGMQAIWPPVPAADGVGTCHWRAAGYDAAAIF